MTDRRTVLFLQGPTSALWRELAAGFEAAGHRTAKINLCVGDSLFWRRPGAIHYRGRLSGWKAFLERIVHQFGVTDILYYGDRLPYHVAAAELARVRGLTAVAVENGYLRPDWLTVERGGMGSFSHFPSDPQMIRALAATLPEPDLAVRYPQGFAEEIASEVLYHLSTYFLRIAYPFYNSGKYYDTLVEFASGIPHLLRAKRLEAAARATIDALTRDGTPYFVVALQLQRDQQIHSNSPYRHISQMIGEVITSFAAHAPAGARLVFKQHPHDNNYENWTRVVAQAARKAGIAERVSLIDGGDLGKLLSKASGCVMINSTVGLFSIRAGCPTKILGIAVYDMPGLTHQGPLDTFWTDAEPVDATLAADLVRVLAGTIQIKGSFYHPEGRKAAIDAIIRRVGQGLINAPGAFVDPPPRLAKARRLGVTAAG